MDLNMPIMDGFDATERILKAQALKIKQMPLGQMEDCKIVAVTAYLNPELA